MKKGYANGAFQALSNRGKYVTSRNSVPVV